MEMVDEVDAENNVLRSVSKDDAHAKGLLHRTVIGEIRDSKGRYVLVKQAPDRQDPGQYVSPIGGHVRSGESDEDALRREALEETGLRDFEFRFIGKFILNRFVRNRQENHYFIVYEIESDEDLILNHESVSYRRFAPEEIGRKLQKGSTEFGGAYVAVVHNLYPDLVEDHL